MKHIKLYNTTSAMNADLTNLEAPYIAVAEDALGSPVIQGPVTTPSLYKIYLSKERGLFGIDEGHQEDNESGLFIKGTHTSLIPGEGSDPVNGLIIITIGVSDIDFNNETLSCDGYIEVPAGTVIRCCLGTSEASNFEIKVLNLEGTSLDYQEPVSGENNTVLLEYTVNSDTYLYLDGDFS